MNDKVIDTTIKVEPPSTPRPAPPPTPPSRLLSFGDMTPSQAKAKREQLLAEQNIRQSSPTGGLKDNIGKPPVDLLSTLALLEMAKVVGHGADKYHPHNWRMGISWSQTYGSAMRHLLAWNDGETNDPATGLSHLAHAATQIMFLIEYALTETGQDDRFSTVSKITTEDYRDPNPIEDTPDGFIVGGTVDWREADKT